MEKIIYDGNFFNLKDTLECGQIFRFYTFKDGYFVISGKNSAYCRQQEGKVFISTKTPEYFHNLFDLQTDYAQIVKSAQNFNIEYLSHAAARGKGIRILRQQQEEMLYSFIVSQNNNIPRIKKILNTLSAKLGEKHEFMGEEYYAFPKTKALALENQDFFAEAGLGYRAKFIEKTSKEIAQGKLDGAEKLSDEELKKLLLSFMGIGDKVADCVLLFGFRRTGSFPVDVWIEKLYKENFGGELKDRAKISKYLSALFGEYSGFIQQYLFYYKRLEQAEKIKNGILS